MNETILAKVKQIIVEQLDIDEIEIDNEATLKELGADSFAEVEIIMYIEEEYGFNMIDKDCYNNLKTVADIVDCIERPVKE